MIHLTALPTWVLVRMLRHFLPESHPWRHRRFTLREWSEGETGFSVSCDFILWLYGVGWIPVLLWLR